MSVFTLRTEKIQGNFVGRDSSVHNGESICPKAQSVVVMGQVGSSLVDLR